MNEQQAEQETGAGQDIDTDPAATRTGVPAINREVTDSSPDMPRRMELTPDAERGRGQAIVSALADSSGVRTGQAGKTAWFTRALTERAHRVARQIEHEPEAGA